MKNNIFLKYYLPVIFWMGIIFFFSSKSGDEYPALFPVASYIFHFFEYLVFGFLLFRLFNFIFEKKCTKFVFIISFIISIVYALSDELHQLFVPLRQADFFDWLIDTIGILGGCWCYIKNNAYISKPHLLLHTCCACCAVYVIDLLKNQFQITAYFFNPNIQPKEEYKKRLNVVKKLCKKEKIKLIQGKYDLKSWRKKIKGLENEKESGKRCENCFDFRLENTAQKAKKSKYAYFATTLTMGPNKKAEIINALGRQWAQKYDIMFYEADFKKKDGFQKSAELSRLNNFYRQNYCGCEFSKR